MIFKFKGQLFNLPVTLGYAAVEAVVKLMCEQDIKGLVGPKMNFLLSFPHPHVVPDPYDFLPWKTALHAKRTFILIPHFCLTRIFPLLPSQNPLNAL